MTRSREKAQLQKDKNTGERKKAQSFWRVICKVGIALGGVGGGGGNGWVSLKYNKINPGDQNLAVSATGLETDNQGGGTQAAKLVGGARRKQESEDPLKGHEDKFSKRENK